LRGGYGYDRRRPGPPKRNAARKGGGKRQFSQGHVIFADALVLFVYLVNAALAFFDRQQASEVAMAIVSIYGAFATGGYFALCAVRDNSLNKYGIGKEGLRDDNG